MDKFKKWLNDILKDRHGSDELSFTLLISGTVILLLGSVLLSPIAVTICFITAVVLFSLALYRTFSKDKARRRSENNKFKSLFVKKSNSIKAAEKEQKRKLKEKHKTHNLFYCPSCKTGCWVPKHKGKVRITCPKCGEKFIGKT